MAPLEALRRWRVPIVRSVTTVFLASWLSFAVQPCLAGTHETAVPGVSHGADHGAPAGDMGHDCPHCPPAPAAQHDCGEGVALECDAIGAPALPSKDCETPKWQPALLSASQGEPADPAADRAGAVDSGALAWRPPDRPLRQRFCSYLK